MAKRKKAQKPNASYEIQAVNFHPQTKRMLGFDPGSRNMGISLAAANASNKVKIVANSIVTSPINDLVNFMPARLAFLEEVDRWVTTYQPHGFIAERFQTRGLLGPLVEQVSVMLGLLAGRYPHIPIKFITAATWKNDYQRRFDFQLDAMYPVCQTTPHQLDASFISVYGLEKGLQRELDFTPQQIMHDAEVSSCVRLIKRKQK